MAKLVIFGAGDIARLAHYYFTRDTGHEVVAFTVDEQYRASDTFLDLPLVPFEGVAENYPPADFQMFVALSYAQMNALRAAKYHEAKSAGYSLASYVSTRCSFLTDNPVGENCFILEDNTIQPFVRIGNNVTLWRAITSAMIRSFTIMSLSLLISLSPGTSMSANTRSSE